MVQCNREQAEINYKKFIKYNPLFRSGKLIEYEELMTNLSDKEEQITKITIDKTEELEQLKLEKNNEISRIKNENDKLKQELKINKEWVKDLEKDKELLGLRTIELNEEIEYFKHVFNIAENDRDKAWEISEDYRLNILKNTKLIKKLEETIEENKQHIKQYDLKIHSISKENNDYKLKIEELTTNEDRYLEKIRILMRENKQLKQEIADYAIDKEEDYPISSSSSISSERTKQTRTIFSSKKSTDSDETQPIRLEINR